MARKWTRSTAALLAFVFSPLAFAADDRDTEDDDAPAEEAPLPSALQGSVAKAFPRAELLASSFERSEQGDAWRLRLRERNVVKHVVMDPGGEVVAACEELAPSDAPWSIRRAVARQFGSPALWHVQHMSGAGEEAWLVSFSQGGRAGHALFDGQGHLVRGEFDGQG